MGRLSLRVSPPASVARFRFGLVLAAALFAVLVLPAFASATKLPLVLEKTGTGQGTVTSSPSGLSCGTSCTEATGNFTEGSTVILTASPKAGSVFAGWFGCNAEPSATECEVTITEEMVVAAEFNEIEKFFLTLEKAGTGTGTVTSSPVGINCGTACSIDEAEYLEGTKVTLTESAGAGAVFEGWTGCDAEPSATKCEVTILGETTVAAEFNEIEKFPLIVEKLGTGTGTVTSSPVGISCSTACSLAEAEYLEKTKVILTASAGAGAVFEGWTGCDAEPSATKCEVTILGETIVQAEFGLSSKSKYSLTITTAGTGTGTVSCNGGACASSYDPGTKVILAASPASGSSFSGFTGGGCSGTGNCTVTINADTTITAIFNANPAPTCATNPSLCPPPPRSGMAKAAGSAQVKGGKAAIKLSCSGGPCQGKLTLTARIKRAYKTTNAVIGKTSFSLADGASATLKVKLISSAKQELNRGKTIKAKLTGATIVASTVKLKPVKK